jgi:hypothetical protein
VDAILNQLQQVIPEVDMFELLTEQSHYETWVIEDTKRKCNLISRYTIQHLAEAQKVEVGDVHREMESRGLLSGSEFTMEIDKVPITAWPFHPDPWDRKVFKVTEENKSDDQKPIPAFNKGALVPPIPDSGSGPAPPISVPADGSLTKAECVRVLNAVTKAGDDHPEGAPIEVLCQRLPQMEFQRMQEALDQLSSEAKVYAPRKGIWRIL